MNNINQYSLISIIIWVLQAQPVEQPQFVEQPQDVEQPKDVEQAQRDGTEERSAVLFSAF